MPEHGKKSLIEHFTVLQNAFPALTANKVPLGAGNYGIVIGDNESHESSNQIVTKFLYRFPPDEQAFAKSSLRNEIRVLQLLHGIHIEDGIQVPQLVSPPEILDHEQFFATYSMTKVAGHGLGRQWEAITSLEEQSRLHFQKAGIFLAKFHAAAALHIGTDNTSLPRFNMAGKISQVPCLDEKTNEKLAAANKYLQKHKKSAIIHGDLHGDNIHSDGINITGILDFSETTLCDNFMMDFVNIPRSCVPYFQQGYEQESGVHIDPAMMTLTSLCADTLHLNFVWDNPYERQAALTDLHLHLDSLPAAVCQ
ncbi:MAG: aminoglycoside phosphotransferase family protein [Alphaproteobacteria bacterium]|nr:aminoglycoside phosphotransferase family protein [Alphaproteobacteria bacterium]